MSQMDPGYLPAARQEIDSRAVEEGHRNHRRRWSHQFKDKGGDVHKVIDINLVRERYRHLRAIRSGYRGLFFFGVFTLTYVYVLRAQHRARDVGDANSALSIFLEKQKADLSSKDSASVYTLMTGKILPFFLSTQWSHNTTSSRLSGTTTNDYFYVVGGVVLTAVKGRSSACFHGNPCFDEMPLAEPFYNMSVPGQEKPFSVPYDDHFKGYSLNVPNSADAKTMASLLSAYKGLFGTDTREIWLHVVLYNPSGFKTLTFLEFGATISVHNDIKMFSNLRTIPYHWYSPQKRKFRIFTECCLVCLTVYAFLRPLALFHFCKPRVRSDTCLEHINQVDSWAKQWNHIPARGGRPLMATSVCVMFLLIGAGVIWARLGFLYSTVADFEDPKYNWMYEDPIKPSDSFDEKLRTALQVMHERTLPISDNVDDITEAYNQYFILHGAIMVLMVLQTQQYLMFQKHLSMVSDTFSGISDDLVHMGVVLAIVCFFFGVVNSLAFGAYDVAFQTIPQSFLDMLLLTFGLYKPASATPFIQSMYKYSTHVLNGSLMLSWLPLAVMIFFKALVPLLLFKLLMGVVMESYKKHKPKDESPSLRSDLWILAKDAFQNMFYWAIRGYVSTEYLALTIAHYERNLPNDCPAWRRHYLGLDSEESVLEALNAVTLHSAPERVRKFVRANSMSQLQGNHKCGIEETAYVLRVFGTNRQKARIKCARQMQSQRERKKTVIENDLVFDDDDGSLQRTLDLMRQEWDGAYHSIEFLRADSKKLFKDHAKSVFQTFDTLSIGTVDHRLMRYLLPQLGFIINDIKLAKLLHKHDGNNDGDTSFKELFTLIHDQSLVGHWKPNAELRDKIKMTDQDDVGYDDVVDVDDFDFDKHEDMRSTPLLQTGRKASRNSCVVA